VPKRSNLFQDVVASVQHHIAGDAVVEESAMLPHRLTGELREVDVVVRGTVAGQEVVLGIEASAAGRPATVQWVEQQVAKHKELGTNKLILVAAAGFSGTARKLAGQYGAVAIAPEDLEGGDPTFAVVNNLASLWAKVYSVTPEGVTVRIDHVKLGEIVELVDPPGDLDIFLGDGTFLCPLSQVVATALDVHSAEYSRSETIRVQAEDSQHSFVVEADPRMGLLINGVPTSIFARWLDGDGSSSLHEVVAIQVRGRGRVSVQEIPLTHQRVGEVDATYGTFEADGQIAALIATVYQGEERVVARIRDGKSGPAREQVLSFARGDSPSSAEVTAPLSDSSRESTVESPGP